MPRNLPDVACMVCGDTPCSCNAKRPIRKASLRETMKATAASAPVVVNPLALPTQKMKVQISPESAATNNAIRILGSAGMLHPTETQRFAMILNGKPTQEERKALWGAKRVQAK